MTTVIKFLIMTTGQILGMFIGFGIVHLIYKITGKKEE